LEEIVEQADEGDLLIAKRALISLQRFEKESKEESLLSDENTMIPIPLTPPKTSQIYPSQNSIQLSHSPASNKSTLKVPYHELRAFKEWKFIVQAK